MSAPAPTCARCGRIRVLSPCRDCATAEESKNYPESPPDPLEKP